MRRHLATVVLLGILLTPTVSGTDNPDPRAAESRLLSLGFTAAAAHERSLSFGPGDLRSACGELPSGASDGPAALPTREPDVTLLDSRGWRTYTVNRRGGGFSSLQKAYDEAVAAHENVRIQVEVGFDAGPLMLRDRKGRNHWIYIEPARLAGFPGDGVRATRGDAARMYKIRGKLTRKSFSEAIWAEPHAGYTRIIGADISVPDDDRRRVHSHLVRIRGDARGSEPDGVEETPRHVVLDRCYVHIPTDGTRFAAFLVGFYGRDIALINSYVIGGGRGWEATKAFNSSYSPGPLLVENNYLATDGINVFLGASAAAHNEWYPSDVTIRRNHIHKPLAWRGDPNLLVKNGFEIKNARRVLFERNVLQNNWVDAQTGKMILLRAEAKDGICEDVTLRYNRIENTPSVWDIAGMDEDVALRSLRRVSIHDNVAIRIGGGSDFGRAGATMRISTHAARPIRSLSFAHNTHDDPGGVGLAISGMDSTGGVDCIFRDNIFAHGRYGVKRDGTVEGTASLDAIFGAGNYTWESNVGADFPAARYPGGANDYPSLLDLRTHFKDAAAHDLRLREQSAYRKGGAKPPSDGTMRGADVELVECLTRGVDGHVSAE